MRISAVLCAAVATAATGFAAGAAPAATPYHAPRNAQGEPEGARSLYEASLEARINTGLFGGAMALVPFLDSGGAGTGTVPDFKGMRYGAGLGMRYETGFGPVRLDVGTPIDRRPGESRIGVYVTLGQAF